MRKGRLRERLNRFKERTRREGGKNIYDGVHNVKDIVDDAVDKFDYVSGAHEKKQNYVMYIALAVVAFLLFKK